jgi:CheY-like chemotaxis protein
VANIPVVDDDPNHASDRHGGNGFAEFNTGHFDLVFLDIFKPTMDGRQTMRLVREPAIPIIAMSGRPVTPDSGSEPDFLALAPAPGAVRGLPKPFKPADLLATIAEHLAAATTRPAQPTPDSNAASRR